MLFKKHWRPRAAASGTRANVASLSCETARSRCHSALAGVDSACHLRISGEPVWKDVVIRSGPFLQ